MADLNALIAQGVQFQAPPNPFAQYAQMQQLQQGEQSNQLNQMKMQEYQRGVQEQNALRGVAGRVGFDPMNPADQAELYRTAPTLAQGIIEKAQLAQKTAGEVKNLSITGGHLQAQTDELAAKTLDQHLANFNKMYSPISAAANGPQGVIDYISAMYKNPILGSVASQMKPLNAALQENLAAYQNDPKTWVAAHSQLNGQSILDTLKGTSQVTNLGGASQQQTIDAFGRPVGPAVNAPITPVPSTAAALQSSGAAASQAATAAAREERMAKGPMGISLSPSQNDALFGENGAVTLGKINPNKINSRNAKMWADAFINNPNSDPVKVAQDVTTADKAIKDFGTGPQGVKVVAFNTAIDHLDTLSKLGDAMKNGDIRIFNTVANALGVQAGQPMATMYNQAAKIVGSEISKAVVPTAGTGKEREETANAFSAAMSPDQLQGADTVAKRLMGGQLASLEQQYKRTTKRSDFADQLLSPAAKAAYTAIRPAAPAQAASGAKFLGFE